MAKYRLDLELSNGNVVQAGEFEVPEGAKPKTITLPEGWIIGDVNHDGLVDWIDAGLINRHSIEPLTGNALAAADIDGNTFVNNSDANYILSPLVREHKSTPYSTDILNNWTFNAETWTYTADIGVEGMSAGDGALVNVIDNQNTKNCGKITGECLNGTLRVTVQRPPTAATRAELIIQSGTGIVIFPNADRINETADRRPTSVIIGTKTSGHTESDCDYLCDGVDDQAEIQTALDSLNPIGGEAVLLRGKYKLTQPIEISYSNITFRGECMGAVTLSLEIENNTSSGISVVTVDSGASRVRVSNLCLNTDNTTGKTPRFGIKVSGNEDIEISNNILDGTTIIGIYDNANEGINIHNNLLIDGFSSTAIQSTSSYSTIENNTIYSNPANYTTTVRGIYTTGEYSKVIGNTVRGCGNGIKSSGINGNIIQNNYIVYSDDINVIPGSSSAGISCNFCDCVSGNYIQNCDIGIQAEQNNLVVIEGNTLLDNSIAIYLNNYHKGLVNANTIYMSKADSMSIWLSDSNDCLVSNNLIWGNNYTDDNGTNNEFINNKHIALEATV